MMKHTHFYVCANTTSFHICFFFFFFCLFFSGSFFVEFVQLDDNVIVLRKEMKNKITHAQKKIKNFLKKFFFFWNMKHP